VKSCIRRRQTNNDQNNLAKGGVALRLYAPGSSTGLACFGLGFDLQISPLPWGSGTSCRNTVCVIRPHKCTCQMASKSVERFSRGTNVTDDRHTTLRRKVYIGIGGIAHAARANPPNNANVGAYSFCATLLVLPPGERL